MRAKQRSAHSPQYKQYKPQQKVQNKVRAELRARIALICQQKMDAKGPSVGLSFYAFFANKNTDPQALMEAASWWIQTHKLDHFEKAHKIKSMVEAGL